MSLNDEADVFRPVCVLNRYKYVCKSIIQKTVEVWPRAHISGQLLSLVDAIWMFFRLRGKPRVTKGDPATMLCEAKERKPNEAQQH